MNQLLASAKQAFGEGRINWPTDTIKALLVDSAAYNFSASHSTLADIPAGARIATSAALTNKTCVNGVFDADDALFTAVTGPTSEAVVLYKDTGTPGTSLLIMYADTSPNLPITPNGADIALKWNDGAVKIFSL